MKRREPKENIHNNRNGKKYIQKTIEHLLWIIIVFCCCCSICIFCCYNIIPPSRPHLIWKAPTQHSNDKNENMKYLCQTYIYIFICKRMNSCVCLCATLSLLHALSSGGRSDTEEWNARRKGNFVGAAWMWTNVNVVNGLRIDRYILLYDFYTEYSVLDATVQIYWKPCGPANKCMVSMKYVADKSNTEIYGFVTVASVQFPYYITTTYMAQRYYSITHHHIYV